MNIRRLVIRAIPLMVMSYPLITKGITATTWQFWVVLLSVFAYDLIGSLLDNYE